MPMKNVKTDPMDVVREIASIHARWRAGEISQEDALFDIGDRLADLFPDDLGAAEADGQD
jgi:hypothetical protein